MFYGAFYKFLFPLDFEIVFVYGFSTLFTLCPFETKRGSIFCFGPGMYFQTGQVFFVPEWPKGEFVSILYWQYFG
jgi:hypothetical protein